MLRLADFLSDDLASAAETAPLITGAVEMLERHPLIGRPIPDSPLRELVISRGRSGYLALYEYNAAAERVIVHAISHQREAGFGED